MTKISSTRRGFLRATLALPLVPQCMKALAPVRPTLVVNPIPAYVMEEISRAVAAAQTAMGTYDPSLGAYHHNSGVVIWEKLK